MSKMTILDKKNVEDVLPLNPSQEGLLFHYLNNRKARYYCEQISLELNGQLDQEVFEKAWGKVLQNHEALRAVFRWEKLSNPVQVIVKDPALPIHFEDISAVKEIAKRVQEIKDQDMALGFDMQTVPLRLQVVKTAARTYQMLLSYHHILFDGWSLGIILHELFDTYQQWVIGSEPRLVSKPALKRHLNFLKQVDKSEQNDFWQNYLEDTDPRFFNSNQKDSTATPQWLTQSTTLPRQQVEAFIAQEQVTLASFLYGVWSLILHRYHNTDDVIFGAVVSGRMHAFEGIEKMVGLFAKTLPFRVQVNGEDRVGEYLRKIRQQQDAWSEQEHSALVDVFSAAGQAHRGEIFDTLIAIENYPINPQLQKQNQSLRISSFSFQETDHYNISLSVSLLEEIEISFSANTEILDEQGLRRLVGHFENTVNQLRQDANASVSSIDILSSQERHQLLHEFNTPITKDLREQTLVDLLEQQAIDSPTKTAVVFKEKTLSYQELHQRANQLAHHLQTLGAQEESLITICMDRSLEMSIAILGILKAGAAYVPIDPNYPADRIQYIIKDTGSKIILTNQASRSKIKASNQLHLLSLDEDWPNIALASNHPPITQLQPNHLAYVIYTSGSTGQPKGVMITHASIQQRLREEVTLLQISKPLKACLLTNYVFDVSLLEFFLPWVTGGSLYIPTQEQLFEPTSLLAALAQQKVNLLQGTPAFLATLIDALTEEPAAALQLERICIGGESLHKNLLTAIHRWLPEVKVNNHYGPTEATIDAIVSPDIKTFEQNIIGKPMANMKAYIVDAQLQLLPIGAVGELLIGGSGLARGYWNSEELTAERFVEHSFGQGARQRLYKTGDLAYYLPDGNIVFVGRKDDQVKIRGYRVELGEVEAALMQWPEVQQGVVIIDGEDSGRKQLVAYLVVTEKYSKTECLEFLQSQLPDYMIPTQLIELEQLPLTASGKVDKKALPKPQVLVAEETAYVAPRSEVEQQLVSIWQSLLGVGKIGVLDNFFELGGHSLLAMRVVSAIRKAMEREVGVKDFFKHPTISQLANLLNTQNGKPTLARIIPDQRGEQIPLSFSQERLWFIDQFGGSSHYHMPAVLNLEGDVDKERLEKALKGIVDRHEVLRTVIHEVEGQTCQRIRSGEKWRLEFEEIESDDLDLSPLIQSTISRPFDLTKDYMLRARLIRLKEQKHTLVLVLHHIACDGWSFSILVEELIAFYRAEQKGQTAALPPLAVQYADYAIWQRKHMSGKQLNTQLDWWTSYLQGVEPLNLPTDFPRPARQSTRGQSLQFEVNAALTQELKALSLKEEATLFMTLLAAFKVLLHRYSRQEDICVGTPVANRNSKEIEGLVGLFLNTLVLRSNLSDNPSFQSLLRQVKTNTLTAYDHQEVPFEQIVERVEPERDLSRSPVFQVVFVMQNTPEIPALELDGLRLTPAALEEQHSKFDLIFSVVEEEEGSLQITVEYCSDLFTAKTIERMTSHFIKLLNAVATQASQPIGQLSLLSASEEKQLLHEFNATEREFPKNKTIIQLFEEQVAKTPNKVALTFEGRELTYSELNAQANQLGAYLKKEYAVKTEDLVALCLERSEWMIIGIFGVLKSGAAYVPIDPEYPKERINYILADSASKLIINEAFIQSFQKEQPNYSKANPPAAAAATNLSYVIYTSGSTGQPKGVLTEHRSVINELSYQRINFGLQPDDRILQTANYVFDASIEQIFLPLLFGATLVLTPRTTLLDSAELDRVLRNEQVTHLHATPSLLKILPPQSYPQLRRVLAGGELCTLELAQSWAPYARFFNKYGPTETTINSTIYEYDESNASDQLTGLPIGKPLGNTQIYILDSYHNLVPLGVVGEVYIGGAGLSRGYLNREELNREKFIASPLHPDERLYRTGDLARWLPNGLLEFKGRVDFQVKVRGYRIELGEIEKVMQQSDRVRQSVVVARADASGSNQLIAYVVAEGDFDKAGIQEYLKTRLPEYMIPQLMIELPELPLTPNGKVDKRALPEPDASGLVANEYTAPRNAIEEQLANIWKSLLNIEQVGIHDNFFELGGHSLLATRVVSAIRKECSAELAIRELFEQPTIAQLGAIIMAQDGEVLLPAIAVQERPEALPLSFSQERLWFIDKLEGSVHYHVPSMFRLKGALDRKALELAFQEIVNRHEVLRTVFKEEQGGVQQQVLPKKQWRMAYSEGTATADVITEEMKLPFDLAADHMLRARLIKEEEFYILILVMHHIASDGWSVSVLVSELMELYAAKVEGRMSPLAPLPLQYADYAIWQRKYLAGDVLDEKLNYWEDKLNGLAPLNLPTDYPRPAVQSTKGAAMKFELDRELTDQLKALANREKGTLFMVLLAAFKVLLYRYSGQTDICVGSPIANRTQAAIEPLIGFFINTLALRSDLSGQPTFTTLLAQVKAMTLEAYAHQEVPFEKVVEKVVKSRDLSRSPLFQTLLVLQNNPNSPAPTLKDVELSEELFPSETAQFDLSFNASETSKGLEIMVEYCVDLYQHSTIERMTQHFVKLLESIVASPQQAIHQLQLLSAVEEQQLLVDFSNKEVVYPKDKTIVDLLDEQLQKTPNHTALIFEEERLSYSDLHQRANQLAHYLIEKGLERETLVAVCLDRSIEMVVALLAILKAGGAYVPIDPDYPQERIQYILDDAKIKYVISRDAFVSLLENKEGIDIIRVDGEATTISSQVAVPLQAILTPDNLAYVIYTSGSTGKPKGALIEHKNVVRLFEHEAPLFDFGEKDIWTLFHSYCFDFSVWEMYGALLYGGTLIIVADEVRKDPSAFGRLLHEKGVTVLNQTPSYFYQLQDALSNDFPPLTLRYLIFGGEALSPGRLDPWHTAYPNCQLINMYGITETTVHVTYKAIGSEEIAAGLSNIGKAIPTLNCHILDPSGQLSPIGVVGELYISGAGLARGYLDRPELTAERFVTHSFSYGDQRLYKTGDLARWLPDGNIEYKGRIDFQVKVRGYRIELGEIEQVMQQSAAVRRSVVIAHQNGNGSNQLVAYIVAEGAYDKAAIQQYLHSRLPKYMIPSLMIELSELPLTANGKVDKGALPKPVAAGLSTNEYVAPRNAIEEQLVAIWTNLLTVEQVGVHDNFFELGGHSLLIMRVVSAIKKEFALNISIKILFQFSSIAELGEYIQVLKLMEEEVDDNEVQVLEL